MVTSLLSVKFLIKDEGAFLATSHLITKEYKRIAHLTGSQNLDFYKERLRGFTDAIKKAHLKMYLEYIIHSSFS